MLKIRYAKKSGMLKNRYAKNTNGPKGQNTHGPESWATAVAPGHMGMGGGRGVGGPVPLASSYVFL